MLSSLWLLFNYHLIPINSTFPLETFYLPADIKPFQNPECSESSPFCVVHPEDSTKPLSEVHITNVKQWIATLHVLRCCCVTVQTHRSRFLQHNNTSKRQWKSNQSQEWQDLREEKWSSGGTNLLSLSMYPPGLAADGPQTRTRAVVANRNDCRTTPGVELHCKMVYRERRRRQVRWCTLYKISRWVAQKRLIWCRPGSQICWFNCQFKFTQRRTNNRNIIFILYYLYCAVFVFHSMMHVL